MPAPIRPRRNRSDFVRTGSFNIRTAESNHIWPVVATRPRLHSAGMPARGAEPLGAEVRRRDPAGTQAEILDVATREFAERGYSGARVDEIAALTRTTKRMIYY